MIRTTFTAELHCQYGRVGVVDTPVAAHPIYSADQDGWLCTEDKRGDSLSFRPVTFKFEFIYERADRLHYDITCEDTWEFAGARLDLNDEGWVGLFGTYIVGRVVDELNPFNWLTNTWKIQPLQQWDGTLERAQEIEFYLRDKDGHRVAHVEARYTRSKPTLRHWFLNAGSKAGEILRFHLHDIKVV